MQIGMIGLGRMGANMVRRLLRYGHKVVVFDRAPSAIEAVVREGAGGAASLADLADRLQAPRVVWLMVPAAVVDSAIAELAPILKPGDTIVDGGNSYYVDDLRRANVGRTQQEHDAETTPLPNPDHYQYDFDVGDIAELWRRGSVVSSWLLDLTASALLGSPDLARYTGRVSDSGEGRWTVKAAIDEAVPAPVLTTALYERFSSRGEGDYANKILSAMRAAFGGHGEKP